MKLIQTTFEGILINLQCHCGGNYICQGKKLWYDPIRILHICNKCKKITWSIYKYPKVKYPPEIILPR